jgi:hypothetical protein
MENELNGKTEIDGFPAYPIYSFHIKWQEDRDGEPSEYDDTTGCLDGKVWNSVQYYDMFNLEYDHNALQIIGVEYFMKQILKHREHLQPLPDIIEVKFVEYETWVLKWFAHETFDVGQTDEEALRSFEQYVARYQKQVKAGRPLVNQTRYLLMGAEDRHHWHGQEPDGSNENYSRPPCRCPHCKERGVLTISH